MQRATLIVCLILLALIVGGCVSGTQQTNTGRKRNKGPNEPVIIGFAMDTLKEERWQRDKDLVEKRAKELGGKILAEPFDVMDAGRMAVVTVSADGPPGTASGSGTRTTSRSPSSSIDARAFSAGGIGRPSAASTAA